MFIVVVVAYYLPIKSNIICPSVDLPQPYGPVKITVF